MILNSSSAGICLCGSHLIYVDGWVRGETREADVSCQKREGYFLANAFMLRVRIVHSIHSRYVYCVMMVVVQVY